MRHFVIALSSLCVIAAVLQAQQQPAPVFRGGVDLVTLDVTVVDKAGNPVKGLTADDFTVMLEGQPRPVRALDFLEFGSSGGADTVAARETTNQLSKPAKRGGRVFLIVFDDLSSTLLQTKGLTVAAERTLASLDVDDLVGLVTTSGLGPVVQPTRDRTAVLSALRSKTLIGRYDDNPAPRFYIGVNEGIDIFRGVTSTLIKVVSRECGIPNYDPRNPPNVKDDLCPNLVEADGRHLGELTVHRTATQMVAYRTLIGAMRAAPKPRVIIALTGGVATSPDFDLKEQADLISRTAAEAGVQFYALTAADMDADFSRKGGVLERREEGNFLNSGAQVVANAAGGEAFLVVGQADRFFTRIQHETSGFYQLGVEAPVSMNQQRLINAKVSVRTPGVTVRVNPHAIVDSVAAEAVPVADRLKTTLAQGGTSFGVPLSLATALRRDPAPGGALQLAVSVAVPAVVQSPLVSMFALVDEAGKVVQEGRKDVPAPHAGEDYQLAVPIPIASGTYRLRFAVADAAGNVGSVEQPINAALPHFGHCAVSQLFTAWTGADGAPRFLALETLPSGATTLRASLELYPDDPANPPNLTVRLTLVPENAGGTTIERDVTPIGSGAMRTVSASLPTGELAAGAYTIRATILEAGAITGTVSTTIRKTATGGDTGLERH